MTDTVTVDEWRKAVRSEKQMPPEKRQLELHMDYLAENGMIVEREYRFHPTRKWRLDFAFPLLKIGIEFQGMFGGMAHRSVNNVMRDAEKSNEAQLHGWILLQVNTASLRDGSAYRQIEAAMAARTEVRR